MERATRTNRSAVRIQRPRVLRPSFRIAAHDTARPIEPLLAAHMVRWRPPAQGDLPPRGLVRSYIVARWCNLNRRRHEELRQAGIRRVTRPCRAAGISKAVAEGSARRFPSRAAESKIKGTFTSGNVLVRRGPGESEVFALPQRFSHESSRVHRQCRHSAPAPLAVPAPPDCQTAGPCHKPPGWV